MKRRVEIVETRRNINYVNELQAWLAELPPEAGLLGIREFDGEITVRWQESR